MSANPEIVELVRQWIEKAEHDLKTAQHTLTLGDDCPFDMVCFHAQQCAEKYLKALLTLHQIDFARTHDLTELAAMVPPEIKLTVESATFQELNPYAVEARYPGLAEMPGRAEAEVAVALASQVRQRVREQLPAEALKR